MEPPSLVPLSDSFVSVVLELAPDGIAVTDEMGRIVHANGYFEQLFGYSREQLLGHSVEMLLPEAVRPAHREHRYHFDELPIARAMGSGLDLWGQHADGTAFSVEVGLSPLSTATGVCTIIAVRPTAARRARDDQAAGDRAVTVERDRMAVALNDQVIRKIFSAGLHLNGLIETATVRQLAALNPAINDLDDAIRDLRNAVFDTDRPARDT